MLSHIDGIILRLRGRKQIARGCRLEQWSKSEGLDEFRIDSNFDIYIANRDIETFGNWVQSGVIPGTHIFCLQIFYTLCATCLKSGEMFCIGHCESCYERTYRDSRKELFGLARKSSTLKKVLVLFSDFPLCEWKHNEQGKIEWIFKE